MPNANALIEVNLIFKRATAEVSFWALAQLHRMKWLRLGKTKREKNRNEEMETFIHSTKNCTLQCTRRVGGWRGSFVSKYDGKRLRWDCDRVGFIISAERTSRRSSKWEVEKIIDTKLDVDSPMNGRENSQRRSKRQDINFCVIYCTFRARDFVLSSRVDGWVTNKASKKWGWMAKFEEWIPWRR